MEAFIEFGELAWITAGGAAAITALLVAQTMLVHRCNRAQHRSAADIWVGMGEAARRLAKGDGEFGDAGTVVEALSRPDTQVDGLAAVVAVLRGEQGHVDEAIYAAIAESSVVKPVSELLRSADPLVRTDALEIIEITRLHGFVGDVASAATDDNEEVARAAANALTVLAPELAVGLLAGRVRTGGVWAVEALGRAIDAVGAAGDSPMAIGKPLWEGAPALAERVLTDDSPIDAADAAEALAVMTDLLHHDDQEHRLSAVRALSKVTDHPAARIALLGALDSPDRVTRFAAAARLADTDAGRLVLRHYAEAGHGSDAGEAAALVLWSDSGSTATVCELKSVAR